MGSMKAVRRFAAFFGCLAAISVILPLSAFGWTRTVDVHSVQMGMSEPCPTCHNCDPCQTATAGCSQICVSPVPTLGSAGPVLPTIERGDAAVPGRLATLDGLSRPPDPFPPRT